ncbi:hypothetical protein BC941DRAFT_445554 [Chlamydoabsidia padenii]|nr:hypothetical protein BC941DRAFT_445554 [Chlamydoabsidia padenii]
MLIGMGSISILSCLVHVLTSKVMTSSPPLLLFGVGCKIQVIHDFIFSKLIGDPFSKCWFSTDSSCYNYLVNSCSRVVVILLLLGCMIDWREGCKMGKTKRNKPFPPQK